MNLSEVFNKWFGGFGRPRVIWAGGTRFSQFSGNIYDHDIVRSIIDCIATHVAKAEALHVRLDDQGRIKDVKRNSPYVKLLNMRPNGIMSGYELKYKLASQFELNNICMAYVRWEGPQPVGIYPIDYQQYQVVKTASGDWGVRFTDQTSTEYLLPLDEVAVARKFFAKDPVYGESNEIIRDRLTTMQAADSGIVDAMGVSNKVRLVHKVKRAIVSNPDAINDASEFAKRFEKAAQERFYCWRRSRLTLPKAAMSAIVAPDVYMFQ